MAPLVSFNLASNRPDNFTALLDNLAETARDRTCFEVLVLIDDEDAAMQALVRREAERRPFRVKWLSAPGEGYFNLWRGINRLHRELCDSEAYYVCNLNDEIRFTSGAWDDVLRHWIGIFPDHLFRLRISQFKFRNYGDFWECGYAPENYAFFTKRWIDLQGDWNACHGPDAFQQFVAYYLAWAYYPAKSTYCRDIPVLDIAIAGEGAFKGLSEAQWRVRARKGWRAWYRLVGHRMQTECSRRARRLQAYIVATSLNLTGYVIDDDRRRREIVVRDLVGRPLPGRDGRPLRFRYRLSWFGITLTNWWRWPLQSYWCGGGPEVLRSAVLQLPLRMVPGLGRLRPILRPIGRPLIRAIEAALVRVETGLDWLFWTLRRFGERG